MAESPTILVIGPRWVGDMVAKSDPQSGVDLLLQAGDLVDLGAELAAIA